MLTATPAFYMYELDNWNDAIDIHMAEIEKTVSWLNGAQDVNRDTEANVHIQTFLNKLQLHRNRKKELIKDIAVLQDYLFNNKLAAGKDHITIQTKKRQKEMRNRVYQAEREYIELMYKCNSFLGEHHKSTKNGKEDHH